MEDTRRKGELMKPIILKAGIPLALSIAGLFYSMFTKRRQLPLDDSSPETQVSSLETVGQEEIRDQDSLHSKEERLLTHIQMTDSLDISQIRDTSNLEEEILGLRNRIDVLHDRERELEIRFLHYCDLKEQESVLVELRYMLALEIAHVEFLGLEIESMEAENWRLEAMVVEYLSVLEELQHARWENGLLQRKVKKLIRTTRERSQVLGQQASILQAREAEILRSHEEFEKRADVIKELENEVTELRRIVDQLQEEKKEFIEKIEFAGASAPSTSQKEPEETAMRDSEQLLTELEQLQKDRAAEVEEVIYLRWINACLRHELTRNQERQIPHQDENGDQSILEFGENVENKDCGLEYDSDHGESCMGVMTSRCTSSRKRRLLNKLKRWVEGCESSKNVWDEKEKLQNKCTGRQSVSYGAGEHHIAARKPCSSP